MTLKASRPRGHGAWRIFGAPLMVAVLSTVGLVSALLGDDLWDVISWLALTVPVVLIVWYWAASRWRHAQAAKQG
jgi:hypothetical protein